MRVKELRVRPLPVLVVVLFLAIAVGDLVTTLREEQPIPPDLLRPGTIRFEPWEPEIDFRLGGDNSDVQLLPEPEPVGSMWSERDSTGAWLLGDDAELQLQLMNGGHRVLVLEARPAAGRRPVRSAGIIVNGVDCGSSTLVPGWQRIELNVPEGAVRVGPNTLRFKIPDRSMVERPRRALHLRRMRLLHGPASRSAHPVSVPVAVDYPRQSVVLHAPGELVTSFTADDRIDALRMEYLFGARSCVGQVTVERPQGEGPGRDTPVHRDLRAWKGGVGHLRVSLHGRRGEFLFRLRLDPCRGNDRLQIRSVDLVREGDRARGRPR